MTGLPMLYPHITMSPQGVPCIDGTRHRVLDIVADHVAHGYSAAQIVEQYPDLTLAQVHGPGPRRADILLRSPGRNGRRLHGELCAGGAAASSSCAAPETRGGTGTPGRLMLRLYMFACFYYPPHSANSALAFWRSVVSKPSVNQW